MNHQTLSKQYGAVLAFSLVMLLLLTLISVGVIQQNKQELVMAGNTLEQTKSFASAEALLKKAEQAIEQSRYSLANPGDPVPADHKCSGASRNVGLIADVSASNASATITAVYCQDSITMTQCNTGNLNDGTSAACSCATSKGTEIYDISVSVSDSNYGSQRTLQSRFAVNCSGGT